MGIVKFISIAVALLAILLGFIAKFQTQLFLLIPNVGFIPWAIAGYKLPPYFSVEVFEEEKFRDFIKPNDVVVSVAAKAGTNWMLYCTNAIRKKGNIEPKVKDMLYTTPWISFADYPMMTWSQKRKLLEEGYGLDGLPLKHHWDHPSYPFRIFKAHELPVDYPDGVSDNKDNVIPFHQFPDVKFIGMVRNGKDVITSWSKFFESHTPAFKKMWGGFPPNHPKPSDALNDFLPGAPTYHIYLGYIKQWWPWRRTKNVLLLHYSDMKKDLETGVKKLADFLGVELNNAELKTVLEQCSIEHMKKVEDIFQLHVYGVNHTVMYVLGGEDFMIKGGGSHKAKTFFTPEMHAIWDNTMQTELPDPEMRKWAESGGGNW